MFENFIYLGRVFFFIYLKQLKYIINSGKVYANLYEIFLTKPIKLYQYPFKVKSEIETEDILFHRMIFKSAYRELKNIYGECFVSGDILYGMKEVNETKTFTSKLFLDGMVEYTITIEPKKQKRTINQKDLEKDSLTKQFIEVLIRDILHANPNLIQKVEH